MTELITVDEFIHDTLEDIESPTKSIFSSKISSVKSTVHSIDESLEEDKSLLGKSRKFVKNVVNSGIGYADTTLGLCDHLEKLGQFALEPSDGNSSDLTAGLCQFSVVHRDLANMFKHLMQNLNSILVFPMETFLQGDLKTDLKKPFDKALKEYEYKYEKLRKEKLQAMKESGVYIPETFALEMAEDLEKERRRLQLEVCEYLIKVNEVKFKKGADFLQHFIDFYHAHLHYLKECVSVMDHFGKSMPDLANRISLLQKQHDAQKRKLVDTRENVRRLLEKEQPKKPRMLVNPAHASTAFPNQPVQMNRAYGTRKSGVLWKRSDGKVKRVWQRRRVYISNSEFCLYHADETKPPVKLLLLTCQLKFPPGQSLLAAGGDPLSLQNGNSVGGTTDSETVGSENQSSEKRSFFLVSNNRTYHFQAEDDRDFDEWTNVLSNAMQAVFNQALNGDDHTGSQNSAFEDGNHFEHLDGSNSNIMLESQYSSSSSKHHRLVGGGVENRDCTSLTGSDADVLDVGTSNYDFNSSTPMLHHPPTAVDCSQLKGRPLHQAIQRIMRRQIPGNDVCADCGRPDPEWVSVNLGVLICLECCGTHRELGVQCSRTQSLLMDDLSTNQLLLPRFIGNRLFNEVYESSLVDSIKPKPSDSTTDAVAMHNRRTFVRSKYLDRRFITSTVGAGACGTVGRSRRKSSGCGRRSSLESSGTVDDDSIGTSFTSSDPDRFLRRDLLRAVKTGDISALLQVHAEGFDLTSSFKNADDPEASEAGDTALHIAVAQTSTSSSADIFRDNRLPLVEFILQNSPISAIQRTNRIGDTPLHHAARLASPDACRLLLHVGDLSTGMFCMKNKENESPLDVCRAHLRAEQDNDSTRRQQLEVCCRLLELAERVQGNKAYEEGGEKRDLFSPPCPEAAIFRGQLAEAIDLLESVSWNFVSSSSFEAAVEGFECGSVALKRSNSTGTSGQEEESLSKLIDRSLSSFRGSSNQSENYEKSNNLGRSGTMQNSSPCHYAFNLQNHSNSLCSTSSKYSNALATLPRKKGPAPRPPNLGVRDSLETSWFSASTDSASENPSSTAVTRRFSATSVRMGDNLLTTVLLPLHSTPHSAKTMAYPVSGRNGSSKTVVKQSVDHIDVLLDVLEEDPVDDDNFPRIKIKDADKQAAAPSYQTQDRSYPATISRTGVGSNSKHEFSQFHLKVEKMEPNLSSKVELKHENCSKKLPRGNTAPINNHPPDVVQPLSEKNEKLVAPPKTKTSGRRAMALYDCEAENPDELSFKKDEVICVVQSVEQDWWEGYIESAPDRSGLFPVPYVKIFLE